MKPTFLFFWPTLSYVSEITVFRTSALAITEATSISVQFTPKAYSRGAKGSKSNQGCLNSTNE